MTDMSEVTNEQLGQLLKYIGTLAERADGFVVEQAPLLAREIVAWHMWSNTALAAMYFAGFVAGVWMARWLWRFPWEDPIHRPIAALPLVFAVAMATAALDCVHTAIKAAVAPRLVVLEYVQRAVK